MVESFLVADNLNRHRFSCAMVSTVKNLPERAFPQSIDDFISIRQMIMGDYEVITSFIIVAVVVRGIVHSGLFLITPCANAVHRRIVQNFCAFVVGQELCKTTVQDLCKIRIVK